jgi:hypothetical protein
MVSIRNYSIKSTLFSELTVIIKPYDPFDLKFSSREVTAWGGPALLKHMLDGLDFRSGVQSWQRPRQAPTVATARSNSSNK